MHVCIRWWFSSILCVPALRIKQRKLKESLLCLYCNKKTNCCSAGVDSLVRKLRGGE